MANTIITKNSSTASAVPTAGDLVQGELAVNVTDKRLFTEDAGGNIVEIGTNPSTINIDAGTIDGTTIGGTTPTTGAFTTLSASTSVTSPSGLFTNLSASGSVTLSGGTANAVAFLNGSKVLTSGSALTFDASGNLALGTTSANLENGGGMVVYNGTVPRISLKNSTSGTTGTDGIDIALSSSDAYFFNRESGAVIIGTSGLERMRIDSSGNLGLGVTPTAWDTVKPMQMANASIYGYSTTEMGVSQNMYYGSGQYRYIASAAASTYRQISGVHSWHIASSGTADDAITFTQAMTLDASGKLGIGTSSPGDKIELGGNGSGIIIRSPNGTRYRLTVTDVGILSIAAA